MSFFTSLTGLNAATTQLSVTSNNIANAGTTGFKRSRSDFGDIFATSPFQKASTVVGQGTTLKQVAQEFSQGNIVLSGNSLDLAITGDGFFPIQTADGTGLQYTRSGSFMLNEDNVVVNSSEQKLRVYGVGDGGEVQKLDGFKDLRIPRVTEGEAKDTTQIALQLTLPTSVNTVTDNEGQPLPFNKNDPETYFTSTNTKVFNKNGENTSVTSYYQKYKDDSPGSSEEKWRTYHFLETQAEDGTITSRPLDIKPAQAKNDTGEPLYVNKYGELKSYAELKDLQQTPAPNDVFYKYYLDDIGSPQKSIPASVTSSEVAATQADSDGVDLSEEINKELRFNAETDVTKGEPGVFTQAAHGLVTGDQVCYDVSSGGDVIEGLIDATEYFVVRTGENTFSLAADAADVAAPSKLIPVTAVGAGEHTFNVTKRADAYYQFQLALDGATGPDANLQTIDLYNIQELSRTTEGGVKGDSLAKFLQSEINRQLGDERKFQTNDATLRITDDDVTLDVKFSSSTSSILEITKKINNELASIDNDVASSANLQNVTVNYNYELNRFQFSGLGQSITLSAGSNSFPAFGLDENGSQVIDTDGFAPVAVPSSDKFLTPEENRRYGVTVEYLPDPDLPDIGTFSISSGKTGDESSIVLKGGGSLIENIFGFTEPEYTVPQQANQDASDIPRGLVSQPAIVSSSRVSLEDGFLVNSSNNSFTVRVNKISETITIPDGTYKIQEFIKEFERRVNSLERDGTSVSGIQMEYKSDVFTVSSSETGDNVFLQVQGPSFFGFDDGPAATGATSRFKVPERASGDMLVQSGTNDLLDSDFINADVTAGIEANDPEPDWRPVFFREGELTFDASGRLLSPVESFALIVDEANPDTGAAGRSLGVDYIGSTQRSGSFTISSQESDGAGEGSLVAVDIADNGIVTATYSNGIAQDRGAIVLANFSTPSGLRQLGDSTFLESADSGDRIVDQPGTVGLGTIRAGATERANVDLTAELVDLITAQRNFQANAKALETSSTLTSTIINIRS